MKKNILLVLLGCFMSICVGAGTQVGANAWTITCDTFVIEDDAQGAGDTVTISHDTSAGQVTVGSGDLIVSVSGTGEFHVPGPGANSTEIGNGANAAGSSGTAYGVNADAQANESTVVGVNSTDANNADCTLIGHNVDASGIRATGIGNGISVAAHGLAAGHATSATGVIATALGTNTNSTHDNSIGLGQNADSAAANQFTIGSVAGSITHIRIAETSGAFTNIRTATALLSSLTGATATSSNLIPDGAFVIGVSTRITTEFGDGNGTTQATIGTAGDPDLWGDTGDKTAGTTTDNSDATNVGAVALYLSATDVIVTAVGGNFDTNGAIRIVVHYLDVTAPTQ